MIRYFKTQLLPSDRDRDTLNKLECSWDVYLPVYFLLRLHEYYGPSGIPLLLLRIDLLYLRPIVRLFGLYVEFSDCFVLKVRKQLRNAFGTSLASRNVEMP